MNGGRNMTIDLKDKVIVITGASRGIGKHLAIELAKEGAKIVVNYNQSVDQVKEMSDYMESITSNVLFIQADVSCVDEVKKLCNQTIEIFGHVDVLINNAGVCSDASISQMSLEQWLSTIDVNLTGTFLCSKFFCHYMANRKMGKILNIASVKGQYGSQNQTNYSASKGGVISFTKSLAKELGNQNVSVNAICPGFISTDMNRMDRQKQYRAKKSSLLPIYYSMDDLTNFVIFLCSNYCSGISGQVFNLDSRIR
jgi:3-oxoacyl-[acyl-carrier protein] reductase